MSVNAGVADRRFESGSDDLPGPQTSSAISRGAFCRSAHVHYADLPTDVRGLWHLRLDERFKGGVLLDAGAHTVPFGYRLAAVRCNGLWSSMA